MHSTSFLAKKLFLTRQFLVLKNAFGIQRIVPVVEQPKGTTVLSLDFSPSPAPSVTKNLTQQTTDAEQKNLDLKSDLDEGDSAKSNSKEVLNGRVKTLHPKIHSGILNIRKNKEHQKQMKINNYKNIDLVIVNFYPFEEVLRQKKKS